MLYFACDAVSSGGRQFAGDGDDVEASVRASHVVCDVVSSGNQQLAGVAGAAGLRQSSPRADAVDRGHFDGRAGRHGEEQRAPGGWRAPRPLPGALRQVRNFHRCVSENLTLWFRMHVVLSILRLCLKIRPCRTVWVP